MPQTGTPPPGLAADSTTTAGGRRPETPAETHARREAWGEQWSRYMQAIGAVAKRDRERHD